MLPRNICILIEDGHLVQRIKVLMVMEQEEEEKWRVEGKGVEKRQNQHLLNIYHFIQWKVVEWMRNHWRLYLFILSNEQSSEATLNLVGSGGFCFFFKWGLWLLRALQTTLVLGCVYLLRRLTRSHPEFPWDAEFFSSFWSLLLISRSLNPLHTYG